MAGRAGPAGRALGVAVAALALGVPLLGMLVAAAPARLVSATPADRTVLAQPPPMVTMTFDRPPVASGTHGSVAVPDGRAEVGRPTVRGRSVSLAVPPAGDGVYLVAYHAEFGGGREVSGTIRFVVRGEARQDVADPSDVSGGARPDDIGRVAPTSIQEEHAHGASGEPWLLVLLGVDLLVLAVVVLRVLRRRRRGRPGRHPDAAPGLR